jgi:hypothetical protein
MHQVRNQFGNQLILLSYQFINITFLSWVVIWKEPIVG